MKRLFGLRAGLWSKKSTLASLFFRNFKETRQKSSQTARCCRSFVAALLRCVRPLSLRFASRVFAVACVLFFCVLRHVRCALSFAYVFWRLLFALSCVELRYVLFFAGFEGKRGATRGKRPWVFSPRVIRADECGRMHSRSALPER